MTSGVIVSATPYGESGFLFRLSGIDNALQLALFAAAAAAEIRENMHPLECVSGFDSIAVKFANPDMRTGAETLGHQRDRVIDLIHATSPPDDGVNQIHHDIPVQYGDEFGPDLTPLAAEKGLTPAQLIERHAAVRYRVMVIGFTPGFAYLGMLDPALHAPRRSTPRAIVPAGSVAIAGGNTAIYPIESSGGWRIIGRTNASLFDPHADNPFRFQHGDVVRFVPAACEFTDGTMT